MLASTQRIFSYQPARIIELASEIARWANPQISMRFPAENRISLRYSAENKEYKKSPSELPGL
jgi:hypothetical protein